MIKNLLLAAAFVLISSCSSLTKDLLKDPEVNITNVALESVSAKDLLIHLKLNIKNPNPIPISLSKVSYALQFSGKKVTEGIFDQGIKIPASGEGDVTVPLKFEYNAIGGLIDGFFKKTLTKDYELNGSAQFGIFSIPFTQKGELKIK